MRSITAMKAITTLTTILILATTVSAQLPSPIKVYAGGGLSIQHKPPTFDGWYKIGWHMTTGVGYSVAPMVELVGSFDYHTFTSDFTKSGDATLGRVGGGDIKAAMFGVNAKVKPSLPMIPIKPYGVAGIGMAKVTQTDFDWPPLTKVGTARFWEDVLGLEDQTKFYYRFGGGVIYSLFPKVSLYAEARYTTIQIDGANTVFDKPLRFWAVTGGVRLM
ncbi:MAG: outer membrane beta-barrel protein [candidate division Zixibacteria bacterium]|nr:outer membrane beta-barrel protein [candidate division Zixibacteria bacterium]MDH3939047.1 outer membrane beta-barrel protein [candidate division Zixibacteria bacterium]MDH4033184.1 outer membrane beta-barrel protein [candidate division Zixibacteria bacterium]